MHVRYLGSFVNVTTFASCKYLLSTPRCPLNNTTTGRIDRNCLSEPVQQALVACFFPSSLSSNARSLLARCKVKWNANTWSFCSANVGDDGAHHLAEALIANSSVTDIDLSWNGIKTKGARRIAQALRENTSLASIDLTGNSIGEEGCWALYKGIHAHKPSMKITYVPLKNLQAYATMIVPFALCRQSHVDRWLLSEECSALLLCTA
eukprot:m.91810 g.91810  ORF g.91810 m.91810 type:complete len:207 (-) comp12962_c0_seq5:482-1102(-)